MPLGMITRHFDHPSGETATLEMPAGWSRNCYYVLTISSTVNPDRRTFETPEAARAAAIAREREALSNGWRPRMAKQAVKPPENDCRLYWPTGEPLHLGVRNYQERVDGAFRTFGGTTKERFGYEPIQQRVFEIDAVVRNGHPPPVLRAGERLLIQNRFADHSERLAAMIVREARLTANARELTAIDIVGIAAELLDDERTVIDRWNDVATIIGELADDPDQSLKRLWELIAARMPGADSAKRAEVQQFVLAERAARQAAEARAIEDQRSRERAEAEQAIARTMSPSQRRMTARQPQPSHSQAEIEAHLRRLAGGQDLGKPKRRQINLE